MEALDPQLLPLLPMVFVAWADGELTPDEAAQVRGLARRLGAPDSALDPWLDPDAPPSSAALRTLAVQLRTAARRFPASSNLADLGIALAEQAERGLSPEHAEALRALGRDLHCDRPDALAELTAPASKPGLGFGALEPASMDPAPWTALLNQRDPEDRAAMFALLAGFERTPELPKAAYREQVLHWTQAVADAGFGLRAFPVTDPAGRVARFTAAFETMAYFDLSLTIKAGVQFGLFAGSIYNLGTAEHHRNFLPQAASLALPGCFAMTERGHGSNVRALATTATYDHATKEIVVHTPDDGARKEWIGNAATHARMATVFAQLVVGGEDHGVHAVLVPIRDAYARPMPGVRIEDCGLKMGLNGVDNGMLWFDQVRVPRANLLNRFGDIDDEGVYSSPIASPSKRFFTMLGTLVGGRVSVSGAAVSVAKSALAIAVRYGARRRQFGPDEGLEVQLLDYRSHQRRLFPKLAATYALAFAQQKLVARFEAQDEADARALEALAAGLKAQATRHCTDTVQACREACGGQGYASRNRFADLKADSDVFATFEGDNTVLLQLVARALLTDFKRQFDDSRVFGTVRHLMGRAASAAYDRNPFIKRWTDESHLRDGQYHLELLQAREADLLDSVASRLRRRISGGMDPFFAFNECQNHLIALGTAHVERVALADFQDAVASLEGEHRRVLELLADLHGLSCIEADRGWFLENGYLDDGKSRAVRDQVDALCLEVRPHAVALVDGFGIPDALLAAPIALAPDA